VHTLTAALAITAARRDVLWESTGLHGRSTVREVELASGRVLRSRQLPKQDFGEGITRHSDRCGECERGAAARGCSGGMRLPRCLLPLLRSSTARCCQPPVVALQAVPGDLDERQDVELRGGRL
jgi:hypothetical protein